MAWISRSIRWIDANKGAFALVGSFFAALGSAGTFVGEHFWATWRAERIAQTTLDEVPKKAERLLTLDCNMLGEVEHHRQQIKAGTKISTFKTIEGDLNKLSDEIEKMVTDNGAVLVDLTTAKGKAARDHMADLVASMDNSLFAIGSALTAFPDDGVADVNASGVQLWAASRYTVVAIVPVADLATKMPPCSVGPYIELVVKAIDDKDPKPPVIVTAEALTPSELAKATKEIKPATIQKIDRAVLRSAVIPKINF
jgi:hypothetical protein